MCFLPTDKSIQLGELHFQGLRILALIGIIKIYLSLNRTNLKLNLIDKLFIFYNSWGAFIYVIASQNKVGALLYKGGVCIDSIILYVVLRYTIQSKETINLITKTFCICMLMLLPFAIYEYYTAQNLFYFLGRTAISIRNGEVRVACTFSHAILFGSFAAALFPVFWAAFITKKTFLKLLAILSCLFIVFSSSSSGPLVALATTVCLLFFFKWKENSKKLVQLIMLSATLIHFIRERSIWHFIYVRIHLKASSTGYHRYLLTEAASKDFWHWWLIGYGDRGADWHIKYWPWTHAKFTDVTNHYLLEGLRGGFLTMLIFIILCYQAIKILGKFSISQTSKNDQWLLWGYTVMLTSHCISFLSVSYFGQITMLMFLSFAIASYAHDEMGKPFSQKK